MRKTHGASDVNQHAASGKGGVMVGFKYHLATGILGWRMSYQVGLWEGLWGIDLIVNWWGRSSPLWAALIFGQVLLSCIRKLASHKPEQFRKQCSFRVSAWDPALMSPSVNQWPGSRNQTDPFLSGYFCEFYCFFCPLLDFSEILRTKL